MKKEFLTVLQQNSKLYNLIRNYPGSDKNFLKERCEVSLPTINKALGELEESGLVQLLDGKYWVEKKAFSLIGISIGSAQTKILVLNAGFEVMKAEEIDGFKKLLCSELEKVIDSGDPFFTKCKKEKLPYVYYSTPQDFVGNKMCLDRVFATIKSVLKNEEKYQLNILSIGISSTGLVNRERQEIVQAHNALCMERESIETLVFDDFKKFLEEEEINIHLEQNSKAAVIAEKMDLYRKDSKMKNCKNMASLYLGAGVGCGLVLNNRLYYGKSGYCGEIAHLPAPQVLHEAEMQKLSQNQNDVDEKCSCGRKNCFDYMIRKYVFGKKKDSFSVMSSEQVAKYLADEKNQLPREIFARYLGAMCEILSNILNVELIVFTGKMHGCETALSKALDIERDKNCLRYNANDCKFVFSDLGASAPAIGSAIAAYYDKLGGEVTWY